MATTGNTSQGCGGCIVKAVGCFGIFLTIIFLLITTFLAGVYFVMSQAGISNIKIPGYGKPAEIIYGLEELQKLEDFLNQGAEVVAPSDQLPLPAVACVQPLNAVTMQIPKGYITSDSVGVGCEDDRWEEVSGATLIWVDPDTEKDFTRLISSFGEVYGFNAEGKLRKIKPSGESAVPAQDTELGADEISDPTIQAPAPTAGSEPFGCGKAFEGDCN